MDGVDHIVQYGALGLLAFLLYHFLMIFKRQNEEVLNAFRELSAEIRRMREAVAELRVAVERLEAITTKDQILECRERATQKNKQTEKH